MKGFENEEAIARAIKEAAPEPGFYIYPNWANPGADQGDLAKVFEAGPIISATVVPDGMGANMVPQMIRGFLISIIGAALLFILMRSMSNTTFPSQVLVAFVAALFVSLVPSLMGWNWWNDPLPFTLVNIAENTIGWTLAGAVIAKIAGRWAES